MRRLLDVLQKDIVNVWNMEDPKDVSDDPTAKTSRSFSPMISISNNQSSLRYYQCWLRIYLTRTGMRLRRCSIVILKVFCWQKQLSFD